MPNLLARQFPPSNTALTVGLQYRSALVTDDVGCDMLPRIGNLGDVHALRRQSGCLLGY